MAPYHDLSDEQWQRVAALLTEWRSRSELRGRPPADARAVLNGVLWVIYSGANWSAMPSRFPAYQTCHRRFKAWHESGALKRVLNELFGIDSNDWCEQIALRMRHASAREGRRSVGSSGTGGLKRPGL